MCHRCPGRYRYSLVCSRCYNFSREYVQYGAIILARCISRAYATMSLSVSVYPSVCLSVTEVHWRIIANLAFTAHCGRGACREKGRDHLALC